MKSQTEKFKEEIRLKNSEKEELIQKIEEMKNNLIRKKSFLNESKISQNPPEISGNKKEN